MLQTCSCSKGFPVILEVSAKEEGSYFAMHSCSHCRNHLFNIELKPGMQIIATEDIVSFNGNYTVPKGRLLRISAFGETHPPYIGLVFAGLFAAGAFYPEGFAAHWDINKILVEEN